MCVRDETDRQTDRDNGYFKSVTFDNHVNLSIGLIDLLIIGLIIRSDYKNVDKLYTY